MARAAPPVYCIDTSALIDLPIYYPRPVFGDTVWRSLELLIGTARLRAPREVRRELARQEGDEVHRWVQRHQNLIVGLDGRQQQLVTEIMQRFPMWVDHATALPVADPVVIALARSYSPPAVVVAHEVVGGHGALKIPNVCQEYGVRYMTLPEMFVNEGWRFQQGSATGTGRRR